ncbi:MAG: DNA translocase FtsK [Anaerolineae bacterium]|nr:DNA translocase FtsK [Anaerolineae bacterium]
MPTYPSPTQSAMTPAQLMHFYAGMIARALEQNRLRPIVVPLFDGPQLRTFALHLEVGVPAERVEKLASAIALAAHSSNCRIARTEGKLVVEVPKTPEERRNLSVALVERSIPPTPWHVALGLSVLGQPVWYNLDDPNTAHLAIGGATGSGKSLALRWLIYRLASQNSPIHLRFVMVDKKGHDLAPFFGHLAHLAHPVVRDPVDGARLLAWASLEMDRRLAADQREPKLVVVIEEIGDLVMVNSAVEGFLTRIAQLGRSAGVHLVVTTQQPGARSLGEALTNFTARLLGRVATATKTFGAAGRAKTMADLLLGRGDFLLITAGDEIRLQVPFSHAAHYSRLPQVARIPSLEAELPAVLHLADLQRDPRGRNGQALDLAAVIEALADGLSAGALAARFGIGYERARRLYAAYHEQEGA